jgi:hypothetical protein
LHLYKRKAQSAKRKALLLASMIEVISLQIQMEEFTKILLYALGFAL